MDAAEVKQMFGIILDKLDSLDSRVGSLESKVDSLDSRVGSLENKVDSLDSRVGSLENKVDLLDSRVGSFENKVTKNSVDIESIRTDIITIIEIQKAHMEQNERDHERIMKHIDDKFGLLEDILKRHSGEITSLKRKIG